MLATNAICDRAAQWRRGAVDFVPGHAARTIARPLLISGFSAFPEIHRRRDNRDYRLRGRIAG